MPLAIWSARLETGIPIIDDQHKELLGAVNKLHDAFGNGTSREDITSHLQFLVAYTVNHFHTEESLMEEWGYPNLREHRGEHDQIARAILELMERWRSPQPPDPLEFSRFCSTWLNHHLMEVDLELSNWSSKLPR